MYGAIAKNKRNTILIMAAFIGLIGGIGWVVSYFYGNRSIALVILAVAIGYALIQYFAAGKLAVAMTGAKPIQKKDNPRLYRIVENLAITTGIPTPKIYVINDAAPNAFATGRDPKHAIVGATTGLLEIMNDRELEAVMAHEIGHVQNYDIRVSTIAFGLVSAIGLLSDVVLRIFIYGDNRSNNNSNPLVLALGLVVVILAPIVAAIVQMAISRQREYLADATGAMTTRDPEALVSALNKLSQQGRPLQKQTSSAANLFMVNPLKKGFFSRLFSSHPPLEDRIKRLQDNENSL